MNNPLRVPAIMADYLAAQKNRRGFGDLIAVLSYAEDHPHDVELLLRAVLWAIKKRLGRTRISYPVPNRVSLEQTLAVVHRFLAERAGGLRLQAVAAALFNCLARHLGLFHRVQTAPVNVADEAAGRTADIHCLNRAGDVVLAAEVKDRRLALVHVQDKLDAIRGSRIRELVFLVRAGVQPDESDPIRTTIRAQFAAGHNIYVCDFDDLLEACMVLCGEAGRTLFLQPVGEQLETLRADLHHRQSWADALRTV